MGYIIMAIIAVIVLAVLAVVFILLGRERKKAARLNQKYEEYRQRRQRAAYATAVVIHARGGVSGDGAEKVLMALTLDVTPAGGEAYRAHTSWVVDVTALGNLQSGANIAVRIDAEDAKIIYPNSTWAEFIPQS